MTAVPLASTSRTRRWHKIVPRSDPFINKQGSGTTSKGREVIDSSIDCILCRLPICCIFSSPSNLNLDLSFDSLLMLFLLLLLLLVMLLMLESALVLSSEIRAVTDFLCSCQSVCHKWILFINSCTTWTSCAWGSRDVYFQLISWTVWWTGRTKYITWSVCRDRSGKDWGSVCGWVCFC